MYGRMCACATANGVKTQQSRHTIQQYTAAAITVHNKRQNVNRATEVEWQRSRATASYPPNYQPVNLPSEQRTVDCVAYRKLLCKRKKTQWRLCICVLCRLGSEAESRRECFSAVCLAKKEHRMANRRAGQQTQADGEGGDSGGSEQTLIGPSDDLCRQHEVRTASELKHLCFHRVASNSVNRSVAY